MKRTRVSNSLKKSLPLLKLVSRMTPANRSKILKDVRGDKTVYNALNEIAYNTKFRKYKLSSGQLKKLKPHAKVINKLSEVKNRNCCSKRKILIQQSGGFLPILIPAVISALGAILSRNG